MNVTELLDELGIPTREQGEHHHAREGWIQTDCPWCSPGTESFRLGFNIRSNYCNCWVCGPCSLWDTIATLADVPVGKIAGQLKDLQTAVFKVKRHTGKLVLPKGLGDLLAAHKEYLRQRGFKPSVIKRLWKIQGIGRLGGENAWSIFIPIIHHDQTVSWTCRTLGPGRRYNSAKNEHSSIPRSQILYGEDYVRWAIVVCEGPTDVWAIGPGATATLGTGYSQDQLLRVAKYPVRAVCFDAEATAQRRARKLVDALAQFPGQTFNITLDAKDAATASKKEIKLLRKTILGD